MTVAIYALLDDRDGNAQERAFEPKVDSVWRHGALVTRPITAALHADAALGRLCADSRFRPPGLSVWAVCRPWR